MHRILQTLGLLFASCAMSSAWSQTYELTINVNGNGSVSATSGSIQNCTSSGGSNCQGAYSSGQSVTVFLTPDVGNEISGWGGDAACVVDSPTQAHVTMNQAHTCTATFGLPQFSYSNGPLISNVQVVPVFFWGSSIDPSITANIPQFLSDMSTSSWYDLLSEYASVGGTGQSIGRGSVAAAVSVGTGTPSTVIDDSTGSPTPLQSQLASLIDNGILPPPQQDGAGNTNTVYILYFPMGTDVNGGGSHACTDYLGYHWSFTYGATNIDLPYAVIPSCPSFPGDPPLLDVITDTSSHELAEMVTDPDSYSTGWLDQAGYEIADVCDTGFGDPYTAGGRTWSVAPLWSKALSACVTTGLSPIFAVAAPATAPAGSPFTFTITAKNPSGNQGTDIAYVGTVHFSSSDPDAVLPADFTFIPEDQGAYGFTATLLNGGAQRITATDTLNGNIVGTSAPITVTAVASQCSGANNYTIPFFDDFAGGGLNPNHWSANSNGGTITVADNSVALSGSPFPYVTALGSPIPAAGNFSVRWIATYGAQQSAGTGSLAITNLLPANGDGSWLDVADAWQDSSGYRVQVQNPAGAQNNAYTDAAPGIVQHDVEYCWLSHTTEVYVDGVQKLQETRDPGVPRPATLWFGNPSNSPNAWQPFTLSHVEVRSLNDAIFRNGFGG